MSRRFLLFQLYGPLAAWGSIAVGDQRPSFDRPSKSAIIGMLAAALGLKRPNTAKDDQTARQLEEEHERLAASYYYACRLEAQGVYLKDYHTVQVPEGKNMPQWIATRTDELIRMKEQARQDPSKGTKQSWREHYAGMRATVGLWRREKDPAYRLDQLASALAQPRFVLYLGRKACPPALPLDPHIDDQAATVREALDRAAMRYTVRLDCLLDHPRHPPSPKAPLQDDAVRYFWESDRDEGFGDDFVEVQRQRWDEPGSRTRWQFARRTEKMASVSFDELTLPESN